MAKVSRVMSTQHPDNVKNPFFANNSVIGGEDEIKEAFYAFSHLNIREQLWDFEGKDVDNHVVKKLLTRYEPFFSENRLGKDFFLTLRVPNPGVEKTEAKVLLETLQSIPRSFDAAKAFYQIDAVPVFEVAVPMATEARQLIRIKRFYEGFVIGQQEKEISKGDAKIKEWIGEFKPEKINVIPLLEDKDSILNSDKIVSEFLEKENIEEYQRVWFARSDPALNYGSASCVLMIKVALQRIHALEDKTSVELLPILGCGSAPFRGNFTPKNVEGMATAYPSMQTYTAQSAFKYDYPLNEVLRGIEKLNSTKRKKPSQIDEEKACQLIAKLSAEYQQQVPLIADFINSFSRHVPQRRKRALHIGLFGYSRGIDKISLPRAIPFCCAMYSAGLPPDILGLNALTPKDTEFLHEAYPGLANDLKDACRFYNEHNIAYFPQEIRRAVEKTREMFPEAFSEPDEKHVKVSGIIMKELAKSSPQLSENILRGGELRGFLG